MKKFVSLLLAGLLSLFCCIGTGAALPETAVPLWDNFWNIDTNISFNGQSGLATASLAGKSGVTEITGILIVHERTATGWRQVDSVTKTVTERDIYLSTSFTGISGVEYRAVFNVTVTRYGVVETEVKSVYVTC